MADIWFSSDFHLFHQKMLDEFRVACPDCKGFAKLNRNACPTHRCWGTGEVPMRPWEKVGEMHEELIQLHNSVVKPRDHWYFLGDLTMERGSRKKWEPTHRLVSRLNGHKRMIPGNHDHFPMKYYLDVFDKVKGYHKIDDLFFSHVPIHPDSIPRGRVNVHGHTHNNPSPTGPYINVSVEVINYTPVNLDWLKTQAKELVRA